MSGRTLKDAMELVCIAAGKQGFRHYDGGGGIWSGTSCDVAEATFTDWGLAESTAVVLNAVATGQLVPKAEMMPLTLSDDDCYQLFLSLDSMARMQGGANELVNSQRERFLPFYRDWHAAHPHEVHPSCRAAVDRV